MSLSNTKTRLAELKKKVDALDADAAPEVKFITLQPGEELPEGTTADDFNLIVRLSDKAHPRSQR